MLVRSSVIIDRPPHAVFRRLSDPTRILEWQEVVEDVRPTEDRDAFVVTLNYADRRRQVAMRCNRVDGDHFVSYNCSTAGAMVALSYRTTPRGRASTVFAEVSIEMTSGGPTAARVLRLFVERELRNGLENLAAQMRAETSDG